MTLIIVQFSPASCYFIGTNRVTCQHCRARPQVAVGGDASRIYSIISYGEPTCGGPPACVLSVELTVLRHIEPSWIRNVTQGLRLGQVLLYW
jgi:hypothetical protein